MVLFLAGCGLRGESDVPAPPAEAPFSPAMLERASPEEDTRLAARSSIEAFLFDGESLLAEGRMPEAVEAFQSYLAFEGPAPMRARAMWGLALAHLAPETESHDPERAHRLLGTLVEEHPLTVQGRQAEWLHGVITELARARSVQAEQRQTIDQLTDLVEQLRRIDLNRRPAGGRPDSLSVNRPRP